MALENGRKIEFSLPLRTHDRRFALAASPLTRSLVINTGNGHAGDSTLSAQPPETVGSEIPQNALEFIITDELRLGERVDSASSWQC